jgi:uncharacterized membrane protein
LLVASLVLGVGLGGFVDGIVLHQLLQWHNMLSSIVPPSDLVAMKYNMVWDGAFHALTWGVTLLGVVLLFRAGRFVSNAWSGRVLAGGMLAGWGLFNLVEGVIDHLLIGLHHVRPGEHQLAWDLGFVLIGGLGFIILGGLLVHRAHGSTWATTAPASLPVLVTARSAPTGIR